MHRADLRDADLENADLRGADLEHADLRGADLKAADLHEAKVTRGALSDEQVKSARNAHAITWMPKNTIGIYALVVEGRKRDVLEAEDSQEKERARKLREKKLQDDAVRVAHALAADGVEHTDDRVSGWLIHDGIVERTAISVGEGHVLHARNPPHPEHERWQLGDDGEIYRNGISLGQPPGAGLQRAPLTNAEMDTAERYDGFGPPVKRTGQLEHR